MFREELGWYDITTSEAALGFKILSSNMQFRGDHSKHNILGIWLQ